MLGTSGASTCKTAGAPPSTCPHACTCAYHTFYRHKGCGAQFQSTNKIHSTVNPMEPVLTEQFRRLAPSPCARGQHRAVVVECASLTRTLVHTGASPRKARQRGHQSERPCSRFAQVFRSCKTTSSLFSCHSQRDGYIVSASSPRGNRWSLVQGSLCTCTAAQNPLQPIPRPVTVAVTEPRWGGSIAHAHPHSQSTDCGPGKQGG